MLGLFSTQVSVQAEISLWPGELKITMNSFPDQAVTYKQIQIKNLKNHSIIVKTQILRPSENKYREGYSSIPDLSWVSVSPIEMAIPPKGEGFFNLTIDIPKQNQSSYYNKNWEVQALFYEKPSTDDGKIAINVKLGSRILINTPTKTAEQRTSVNLFVLAWFIGMAGLAVAVVALHLRGRYSRQKAAIFYVKDKHQKHHKRK